MSKMTVTDLTNLQGKVVLVRVDFNVPMKNGVITTVEMFYLIPISTIGIHQKN